MTELERLKRENEGLRKSVQKYKMQNNKLIKIFWEKIFPMFAGYKTGLEIGEYNLKQGRSEKQKEFFRGRNTVFESIIKDFEEVKKEYFKIFDNV